MATLLKKFGFTKTFGLNGAFFEESRNRETMHTLLEQNGLPIPLQVTCDNKEEDVGKILVEAGISLPVYIKPVVSDQYDEGFNSGRRVDDIDTLSELISDLPDDTKVMIQEFIVGSE